MFRRLLRSKINRSTSAPARSDDPPDTLESVNANRPSSDHGLFDSTERHPASPPTPSPTSERRILQLQTPRMPQVIQEKVKELAAFESCIEACDALAASSTPSSRKDPKTGLMDASVLVSPDGDLLLIPQELESTAELGNHKTFSKELELSGDYQDAVFMGSDLSGDQERNGFSARGWSIAATSLAVEQTNQGLSDMADFVEELILSKKEGAARTSLACDNLLSAMDAAREHRLDPARIKEITEFGTKLELTNSRVGPMLFAGGTLRAATVALEQYYSIMSEHDANRWRAASMRNGPLPKLLKAAEETKARAKNREMALKEMHRRAAAMEDYLAKCKEQAKRRWDAVHDAEEMVTKVVEERMLLRSRQREKERLEQFQQTEDKGGTDLGATSAEIWDIVSAVAESMEGGSFEPMDLPKAPLTGPRDKASDEPTELQVEKSPSKSSLDSLPIASRVEIEQQCGLPELRAAAMAADEAVEDAAGSLLNILSNLDTTRRSAQISAETCVLRACSSQANCIRSLVKMEREAIEERLKTLESLEQLAENIDVRADLSAYIDHDKKEAGGRAHLGDDDDGGVAAALAVLSSHVDGNMGLGYTSKISTEDWDDGEESQEMSAEAMDAAIGSIFEVNELLLPPTSDSQASREARQAFEARVELLCKACADMSSSGRSRRSKVCYSLNGRRSTHAELPSPIQFDGLCRLFSQILSGCDCESSGVSTAKMCMMLAQTFYMEQTDPGPRASTSENELLSPTREARKNRVFVKSRLTDHPLWEQEEFWDQALYQCVSESLTHSGVMANFERASMLTPRKKSEWTETRKMKWHDLTHAERSEAASQVHAVVFAQLGALAHSMMEFGCGIERSCAFVRRMSIRNQLPISQRTMLLQHLLSGKPNAKDNGALTSKAKRVLPGPPIDSGSAPRTPVKDATDPDTPNTDEPKEETSSAPSENIDSQGVQEAGAER